MEENDDLLANFVKNGDFKQNTQPNIEKGIEYIGPNARQKVEKIEADSNYINIPINELPHRLFYKEGIRISIRPVKTKEIQSFAVVNEKNPYDVQVKLNDILAACIKIEDLTNKEPVSYLDIKDGDRDTIAIVIARASAKYGKKIEKLVKCACNLDVNVQLIPANYIYKDHHEKIAPFFNNDTKLYEFPLKNGAKVSLGVPTIGLVQDINNYVLVKSTKSQGKEAPNVAFMQIFAYIQAGKGIKSMTYDEIAQGEYEFSKMSQEMFEFIYDTVDMIIFGIEDVKTTCTCGREVHTKFGFPNGPRDLFLTKSAFDEFIRQ